MSYTIWPDGKTGDVLSQVNDERNRQEELIQEGKFLYSCASDRLTQEQKLAILAEEFGEVSKEVTELIIAKTKAHPDRPTGQALIMAKIRKELIQVAAVAVAWAESLE